MNNQVKILLSIQGIAGGTLRKVGSKKIPFKKMIRHKGKEILITNPPWIKKKSEKAEWVSMSPIKRLERHFARTCQAEGGTGFTYSILED